MPESLNNEDIQRDIIFGDRISGDKYIAEHDINITQQTIINGMQIKDIEDLPPTAGFSPYKGLEYFKEEDTNLFFGRDGLISTLVQRLHETNMLALIGKSGSGKSSVVRAGLIPTVRGRKKLEDGTVPPLGKWRIFVMTPSSQPMQRLAATLIPEDQQRQLKLFQLLDQNPDKLGVLLPRFIRKGKEDNLLLFVDQFEELFTQCKDPVQRTCFVDGLLSAIDDPRCKIVLTLRADFYGHGLEHEGLRETLKANQETLGPISIEELREVILKPAEIQGWDIQEGLDDLMLRDVGREPGRLPLLSHALHETWKRRRGTVLTLSGYTEAGEVSGAIAQSAETVFRRLDKGQQQVAEATFLALTELGEGSEDTRRVTQRQELVEITSRPIEEIDLVLAQLIAARLITIGDDDEIEVAHEALIRNWPRLRGWLEANRERLRFERQVMRDAEEWSESNQSADLLYRGSRLQRALEWLSVGSVSSNRTFTRFIGASRELAEREALEARQQQERELQQARELEEAQRLRAEEAVEAAGQLRTSRNRIRMWAAAGFALAILATGLFFFALNQATFAQEQTEVAESKSEELETQTRKTLSNALVASAQTVNDQELRLLLAVEGLRATIDSEETASENAISELQNSIVVGLEKVVGLDSSYFILSSDSGLHFSPDGRYLALPSGIDSDSAQIIDLSTFSSLPLTSNLQGARRFQFSPGGTSLAVKHDGIISIVDSTTFENRCDPFEFGDYDAQMIFSPDENFLFANEYDAVSTKEAAGGNLWDITNCQLVGSYANASGGELVKAFFSENKLVMINTTEESEKNTVVSGWDYTSSEDSQLIYSETFDYASFSSNIALSGDLTRFAIFSDGILEVYDSNSGSTIFSEPVEGDRINRPYLSHNGNHVGLLSKPSSSYSKGEVRIWDIENSKALPEINPFAGNEDFITSVVVSREDGLFVVYKNRSVDQIEIWDFTTGELLKSPQRFANKSIGPILTDPFGETLFISLSNGTVSQWHIDELFEVQRFADDLNGRSTLMVSPYDGMIAFIDLSGTVRFWKNRAFNSDVLIADEEDQQLQKLILIGDNELGLSNKIVDSIASLPIKLCGASNIIPEHQINQSWLLIDQYDNQNGSCEDVGSQLWDLSQSPPQLMWHHKNIHVLLPFGVGLESISISEDGQRIGIIYLGGDAIDPIIRDSDDLAFLERLQNELDSTEGIIVWDMAKPQYPQIVPHEEAGSDWPTLVAMHPTRPIAITVMDDFADFSR
ncbi:MAG: hypothetical protein AAF633_11220, partial [Chloroflexota bacterium]